MKKFLLLWAFSLAFFLSSAQTQNNKNYLPEAGDWGVSFSANPIINLVGNLIRIGSNDNFYNPLYLGLSKTFRHFTTNDKARVYYISVSGFAERIENDYPITQPQYTIISDLYYGIYFDAQMGFGKEKRFTKGKFQTFIGHINLINLKFADQKVEYGDNPDLTVESRYPYSTIFNLKNIEYPGIIGWGIIPSRILHSTYGRAVGLGENIYFGLEYFFLPKVSIGGSFYFNLNVDYYFPYVETFERYDIDNQVVEQYDEKYPGFFVGSVNQTFNSALMLRIYFR